MKYPKKTTQILREIAKKNLSGLDARVFMDWLADNKGFNPSASVIAGRIGTTREKVSLALKRLREKSILKDNGFVELPSGQKTNRYDLHDDIKDLCEINKTKHKKKADKTINDDKELARKDMFARKEGYASHKQKEEYLAQYPILTPEMIREREEKIKKSFKD